MRIVLLLLTTLLLCQSSNLLSQQQESWETYIATTKINGHLDRGDHVLLATDGGISVYDKATKQVTETWTRQTHGLPSNMVESIVVKPQTQELIIGTYDLGVFRQVAGDNSQWEAIPFPESYNSSYSPLLYDLAFDDQDRLLAGSSSGLWVLTADNEWLHYNAANTEGSLGSVWDMITAPDGTVYIGSHLLFKLSNGELQEHIPTTFDGCNFDSIHFSYGDRKLHLSPTGDLWSINDNGQAARFTTEGKWELYGYQFGPQDLVFSINDNTFFDANGDFYIESLDYEYFRFQEGSFVATPLSPELATLSDIRLAGEDLLGLSGDSLFTSSEATDVQYAGKLGSWPWEDPISQLFTDQEGNCWGKLGSNKIINLSQGYQVASPTPNSGSTFFRNIYFTGGPESSAWLQYANNLLYWEDQQTVIEYPFAPGHETQSASIRYAAIATDGTPWFSTSLHEIYTLIDGQWVRQLQLPDNQYVSNIIPFPSNRVLITVLNFSAGNEALLLGPGISAPFTFPDAIQESANYWYPFKGEAPGEVWFYDHNQHQLIKGYQGVASVINLPMAWPQSSSVNSFQSFDGKLVMANDDVIIVHDGENWRTFNHENAPIETSHITAAKFDIDGALSITHANFRPAMERLTTEVASSTKAPSISHKNDQQLIVFPNPASAQISFISNHGQQYQLLNMLGQTVLKGQTSTATTTIDVSQIKAGNYCLRVGQRAGIVSIQ